MKKKYLMGGGILTLLLLGSCSEENGLNPGNGGNELPDGQTYLTVRIIDAGANTRASGGNPEFEDGTDAEHNVEDASFFFYDAGEAYAAEASVWDGGDADGTANDHIEFNGNTVIVLHGQEKNNFPKYMVTVLNVPDGYKPGSTLDAMLATLSGGIYQGNGSNNFIMSTTSYARNNTPYFVTELTADNFHKEPMTDADAPVDVYVERLAAKVTLDVNDQIGNKTTNGLYKLNVTVAGDDNDDAEDGTTGADIYVKLLGWGLNATAKNSYMMKNINESWKSEATGLGFSWNDASNFRSYWGMSYNYNDAETDYPTNAAGVATDTDCKLNYISAAAATTDLGKSAYCALGHGALQRHAFL